MTKANEGKFRNENDARQGCIMSPWFFAKEIITGRRMMGAIFSEEGENGDCLGPAICRRPGIIGKSKEDLRIIEICKRSGLKMITDESNVFVL